jgi:hypothetical protein
LSDHQSVVENPVPFDAPAIRRYGIEAWCVDYPCPVHCRDFARFVDALFDGLETAFATLQRDDQETLLACSDFVGTLRDVLYAEAFAQWSADRRRRVDMAPQTRQGLAIDVEALANPYLRTAQKDARLVLRSAARSWVENRPFGTIAQARASFASLTARGDAWSVGTMGGLKRQWLAAGGERTRTVYAEYVIGQALARASEKLSPGLDAAIDRFSDTLGTVVGEALARGLASPRFSTGDLIEMFKRRLATTCGLIEAVRSSVARPPSRIYLNEVWKPSHRLLAIALRGLGAQVTGFTHGNDPMHVLQRQHAFMAFGHVTTYVCETEGSAVAHAAHFRNSPVSRVFPVEFQSAGTTEYAQQFASARPTSAPTGPIRVMVMGYPLLPHRTQYDVTNGLAMHLEAEIRLLKLLRKRGYHAIYKAHPETRAQAEGLFDAAASEVSFEPFERITDRCDVILFLTTVSSTFGAALCTRKPVVVLNHAGKAWNPINADLYVRRCRLVPSWLDDNNRIQFNEEALIDALAVPGAAPDFSIVARVFTPGPWTGPTTIEATDAGRMSVGQTGAHG